ncbi:hypothetical protein RB2501_12157 [Robiginitalea biformata HTCC2501]|uniref:Uncharacterized protein n=1 Tax=Robiginitalea biformata (strain ATCC BAA-864 / DSM 15991 / KCTC 12146 / HTCC2501) TaxID=313596 RepID=A4CN38_ROBBH|nr:hypothetical protein RB2501_12157 [Robiginitalea biformata HTCC2501]
MDIPKEALYILVPVIFLALAMGLLNYLTRNGRNFRSSRNRRARKQD